MQTNENTFKQKPTNNAYKTISDDLRSIKQEGAHIADTVMEQGQETYDHLKSSSTRYMKMLEREVTAKPVQSMAIAVGAGMLLSFLLRRA